VAFSGSSNRARIRLLVAVRIGHKPVVIPLTGAKFPHCPDIKQYPKPSGGYYTKMSAAEYCDALAVIFREGTAGAQGLRSRSVALWHDHDTTHLAATTSAWLATRGVPTYVLSVRSPDLDPLDYGVFGAVKNRLRRRAWVEHSSWEQQCTTLMADLRGVQADAAIRELPLRLQAVIDADGGHICPSNLEQLKRQAMAGTRQGVS
jgi:hypothetical protein